MIGSYDFECHQLHAPCPDPVRRDEAPGPGDAPPAGRPPAQQRCCAGRQPGPRGEGESEKAEFGWTARWGQPARAGARRPLEIAAARAARGRRVRVGQLRAEPLAADSGVVPQYVEPCVPVLTHKPTAPLGNLPVPPAGFSVIGRVQPHPYAAGQADEQGDPEPAGVTQGTGDTGDVAAA
jgi:hypothetical protein